MVAYGSRRDWKRSSSDVRLDRRETGKFLQLRQHGSGARIRASDVREARWQAWRRRSTHSRTHHHHHQHATRVRGRLRRVHGADLKSTAQLEEVLEESLRSLVAMSVPQIMEEIMEVIRLVSQERIHERIVEETIDVPFSRVMEETIEVEKLNGSCAAQAPEWKEPRRLRDEELVTIRDTNKLLNDCDELILKWLNLVKDVIDSQDILLNIYRKILQQNKIFRVIKMNLAKKYLEMFAEIAKRKDDNYKKFYEQFGERLKLGIHKSSNDGVEISELLRFITCKPGDEQISFKEYVDRMKEGQNDICCITDDSIAVVSSSSFRENLRKEGYEVPYMADPVDELAVQQPKEFDGTKPKPTTKEGLDPGDQDEEKAFEELMKETLGDKVEEAIVNDRSVDSLRAHVMSEHADTKRIMKAQAPRDSSQAVASNNCKQHNKRERKKERKGEGERGRSAQEEKGQEERESLRKGQRGREQEGRKKEEEKETEEGGGEQIEKDVTGWTDVTRKKRRKTVQIFVKMNGSTATPMEVNLTNDKVEDVLRQVQSDEDVYVTMHGRMLKRSERLRSYGVTNGCTIQVTSRLRGQREIQARLQQEELRRANWWSRLWVGLPLLPVDVENRIATISGYVQVFTGALGESLMLLAVRICPFTIELTDSTEVPVQRARQSRASWDIVDSQSQCLHQCVHDRERDASIPAVRRLRQRRRQGLLRGQVARRYGHPAHCARGKTACILDRALSQDGWCWILHVMSFTIPLTGSTIVTTPAVVTTYSASADYADSATPTCSGDVCVTMSCGGGSFTPDGAYDSLWDNVKPMMGSASTWDWWCRLRFSMQLGNGSHHLRVVPAFRAWDMSNGPCQQVGSAEGGCRHSRTLHLFCLILPAVICGHTGGLWLKAWLKKVIVRRAFRPSWDR